MRSLFRKIREANRPFCTALVAAAGSSSRMGGTDKLMKFLDNVPVLMRTLTALQRAAAIDETDALELTDIDTPEALKQAGSAG